MYINQISPYTFYAKPPRKLVPLKQYLEEGKIILELTQGDIEAIEKIKSEIGILELEVSKLEDILAKTFDNRKYYYLEQIGNKEYEIEQKRNEIEEIKQNRLEIQKMIAQKMRKKS